MKLKKFILAVIASLVILPAFSAASNSAWYSEADLTGQKFYKFAENEYLQLFFAEEKSILAVRQKNNGYVWYSAPLDWEDDDETSGFVLNSVPSFLTVRSKDQNSIFRNANSYTNVFLRNGLEVLQIKDGIRLNHNFTADGFFIPLEITIDGNSLVMTVPVNEIYEDHDSEIPPLEILDFEINPYFGCAPEDEDGFIFVPDGSGALINFNSSSPSLYSQYVYGRDNSIVATRRKNVTQNACLPVFGLSRKDSAFIAVIESGESRATIQADAGQQSVYNAVSAGFIVRDFDSVSFRERTGTPRDVVIYEKTDFEKSEDVYSVRYIFIDKEDNSLAGMAAAYRKYLQENKGFTTQPDQSEPALTIDFIGSSNKKRTIAGLPMNVGVAYTPFSSVKSTLETLKEKGLSNFNVKFEGWVKGGVLGKYPSSPKPQSLLGGKRQFRKMTDYLEENNIPLYLGVDFVHLYSSDLSHIKELTANRMINRSPVKVPDYRMSTYTDEKISDKYPFYILRSEKVEKDFGRFFNRFARKIDYAGLSPDSLGNILSSDFGPNGIRRNKVEEKFVSMLQESSYQKKMMLSAPFAYALPFASYVSDLPSKSSRYDVEDAEVPFYQMVIKGYLPFSNLPANRNTNMEEYKLKLLESGADISFVWITQNPDLISDSRMQSYVNLYSQDWIDDAAALYKEVTEVNSKVKGCTIVDYKIDGDIRSSTYSNGITVTVNYADGSYSVTGGNAE